MKLASRVGWDAAKNRLTRLLEERRRSGLQVLDLTETNPTRCGFDYPVKFRAFQNGLAVCTVLPCFDSPYPNEGRPATDDSTDLGVLTDGN